MIIEHGVFERYSDPRRNGSTYQTEDGLDWQRFVFMRVLFNDFGAVLDLYEGTTNDKITTPRFFAAVKDGVAVQAISRDVSALVASLPALVVETDQPIEMGYLYGNGEFTAPPPPPAVVNKSDILSAMTDQNFDDFEANWPLMSPKQRMLWDSTASWTEGTSQWRDAQALLLALIGPDAYQFFPQ